MNFLSCLLKIALHYISKNISLLYFLASGVKAQIRIVCQPEVLMFSLSFFPLSPSLSLSSFLYIRTHNLCLLLMSIIFERKYTRTYSINQRYSRNQNNLLHTLDERNSRLLDQKWREEREAEISFLHYRLQKKKKKITNRLNNIINLQKCTE